MNATRYVRRVRRQYIHYSLVLQANDLANALYQRTMDAIGTRINNTDINRLCGTHAKAVRRALRRSDRYNRFNGYHYGFLR